MKILLISRPRCRTSVFCDTASQFYQIPNFHEELDYAQIQKNELYKLQLTKQTNILSSLQSSQISYIKQVLNKVITINGIVKLFPRHILTYKSHERYRMAENFNNFKYICNTNISEIFHLHTFDHIFLLERDLIESSLSYAACLKTGHWLFPNNKNLINYTNKIQLELDTQQLNELDFYIFEYLLYNQLKDFILTNFNNLTILNYNTCIDFINEKYKNIKKANTIDTQFNYRKKYKNYEKIVNYINSKYLLHTKNIPIFKFT